jgi:hypothetical protein
MRLTEKCLPTSPEHVDPGHPVEPLGIVDHDGIGRAVAEGQQPLEHFPDAGDIG